MTFTTAQTDSCTATVPTLYGLLRTTPMRDLLRGRLSGRLDVPRILDESGLPDPIVQVVRDVVRRTRLSRLEKSDLARELVAHFQDGLESGGSENDALGAFGDVGRAARLMRRAKIRTRSRVWKTWSFCVRAMALFFGALLVLYAIQAVRVFTASPVLKLNVLEQINAEARSLPESERAWPRYRAAALATTKPPAGLHLSEVHPGHEKWDLAVAYVKENAGALEQYRAAAAMPRIGVTYSMASDVELDFRFAEERERRMAEAKENAATPEENPVAFSILLPQLSYLRESAHILRIDAFIAAAEGDADRVVADVDAMLGIVEHLEQMPFLISDLVSLAVLGMTTDTAGRLVAENAGLLSDAQLVHASHRLAGARGGRLQADLESERLSFEDVLQRIYSDDGSGDGILTSPGGSLLSSLSSEGSGIDADTLQRLAVPAFSLVLAGRAEMSKKYNEVFDVEIAESREPLWRRADSKADIARLQLADNAWTRMRYAPIGMLMPSLSRAGASGWLALQRRDAALTVLALELYRREHGDWPSSLNDLAPRYLPAVPLDQFDGKPLRYRLADGRPLIYSVGADGKDDGGRVDTGPQGLARACRWAAPSAVAAARQDPTWAAPTRNTEIADGDWVLWPPYDEP